MPSSESPNGPQEHSNPNTESYLKLEDRDEQRWLTALVTSWILPVGLLALIVSMAARFGYPSPLPLWGDMLVFIVAGTIWVMSPWGNKVTQWFYNRAEEQSRRRNRK